MPRITRWMIKSSFLYFSVGITMGAYLLLHKAWSISPASWSVLPYHIEIMIFGWILQFVMAVAYWMMPRFVEGPPRGPRWHSWVMFGLLNGGIWLHLAGLALGKMGWMILIGRILEVGAVAMFVKIHWSRIYGIRAFH